MTYAPRVHFRVLIWDGMFAFFEANFCFLVVCSFLCRFQSVVKICARKSYIILAKCFLMHLYEHSIGNSLEKRPIFGYFEKLTLCHLLIWKDTKATGIVCDLNASVRSRFNQFWQLFSINIASVFILVKFNTVYDFLALESVF
jgi:hypothetical protein